MKKFRNNYAKSHKLIGKYCLLGARRYCLYGQYSTGIFLNARGGSGETAKTGKTPKPQTRFCLFVREPRR